MYKAIALFLIGFMAFGGTTSALSVDSVRVLDGNTCPANPTSLIKSVPAFDLTVAPGAVIALSGSPSGTSQLGPFFALIEIIVQRTDQTTAVYRADWRMGSVCTPNTLGAQDLTPIFKPGLNTVSISIVGAQHSNSLYYAWFPATYLVATTGHIVSAQM